MNKFNNIKLNLKYSGLLLLATLAVNIPLASAKEANKKDQATVTSVILPNTQVLPSEWQFRLSPQSPNAAEHSKITEWHSAKIPSMVHTDLLANKLIVDPYQGMPEAGLQWIGLSQWEYKTQFDLDQQSLQRQNYELVFEGLDTFATVILNGQTILNADNSHRTWRVPVKNIVREKDNSLQIIFDSPINKLLPEVQAMPEKIAGNYPSPYGDEPKDAMIGNFVRKPGYHFGWDWGPRYVTAGIWRPVKLESWDNVKLNHFQIRQDNISAENASITIIPEIQSQVSERVYLKLSVTAPNGQALPVAEMPIDIVSQQGFNSTEWEVQIPNPERWWPVGYGKQNLYSFNLQILNEKRQLIDEMQKRTGLRKVVLENKRDAWGQNFAFLINDVPVFAKGANVIPMDSFPSRVTPEQLRTMMVGARDGNMNMLRNWGGGYYESDGFFELADELGLMIWQDFMFGGGMQPGYKVEFRNNVVNEARDNIRRLQHHPSIVLWCGNNEEETAWKDWGHSKQLLKQNPIFAADVWQGYIDLFGKDLRAVVAEEAGGIPYWSSSPSNDLNGASNSSDYGDKHYWDVWAGSKPISQYLVETPRFMSEYGLQAWPSLETIQSVTGDADLAVDSPVIKARQKFLAGEGNQRLLLYIRQEYGEPKNFADFVYLSQIMQAEGIELAALHHRSERPRTMGSLYWQLNDVWQGASWSSLDYYGNWKPLHFHAKRFYAPVAVAALRLENKTQVNVVSDLMEATPMQLSMKVMDFNGKVLSEKTQSLSVNPLSAMKVMEYSDEQLLGSANAKNTLAVFQLKGADNRVVSESVVYFAAAKDLALSNTQAAMDLKEVAPNEYQLTLTSPTLLRGLWVDFKGKKAVLDNNAVTVLPNQPVVIHIKSSASLNDLKAAATLRSLANVTH